jgi:hypothetical protein
MLVVVMMLKVPPKEDRTFESRHSSTADGVLVADRVRLFHGSIADAPLPHAWWC